MQRLFTMFPSGRAGVALLCLRVGVIAALFLGVGLTHSRSPHLAWVVTVLGLSLGAGFATPICAALCGIVEIYLCLEQGGAAAVAALVALALTLLGPGAYSLDARLFGRQRLVFKNRVARHEE